MTYRSVFKPGLFEGRTVVVTGGGSGIGRCTAHEIAALGAHVVITGRKQEKLDKVRAEIAAGRGVRRRFTSFDIRERKPR
jgi:citronellol/citronellal dehydrogenase